MSTFLEDIQFALRNFLRIPGVSLLIIATLALGIGANAAIFSMVYNVLLGPLPFEGGDRIVKIQTNNPSIERYDVPVSVGTLFDYRQQNETFSHVVEYHQMSFTLLGHGDPSYVETGVVSWNYFEMLGIKPILGRTFIVGEDAQGAEPLIVLSNRYWHEKFGGNANVIGMNLQMNNKVHQVIGVLPPMPAYPVDNDIWVAATTCPGRGSDDWINNRQFNALTVYGKLKSNTSLDQGQQDLNAVSSRLLMAYPDAYSSVAGLSTSLKTLRAEMAGESATTFYLLMAITALVLLIACANVANLNLARMAVRDQELAIREALGANPRRIARQVFTESVLLSIAGGVLGLIIAFLSIDLLSGFAARYTPLASEVGINGSVLVFCLIVSVLTGIVSGSTAAFQRRNINTALKEGSGNITASSTSKRIRQALLVLQFSLAFIILTGAALVSLSLYRLNNQDTGFSTEDIVAVDLTLNFSHYGQLPERRTFARELSRELQAHPLIESVGYGSTFPLAEIRRERSFFQIEGKPPASANERPDALGFSASANFHEVLNIPLLQGRYLQESDDENSPGSILINQRFAQQFFPNENPIDKRISLDEGRTWLSIRGVVGDVRAIGIDTPPVPSFYVPYLEFPTFPLRVVLKSSASQFELQEDIYSIVGGINPEQAITAITTMRLIRDDWLSSSQLAGLLIGIFAGLAFLITLSGVIGVVAYNVSQRFKEVGIRMAFGANPRHVRNLFTMQGLSLGLLGVLIGAIAMLFLSPIFGEVLFETSPFNISMYLLTALVVTVTALIAILFPTRQAVNIQPTKALRDQ
jgi:predicted permease